MDRSAERALKASVREEVASRLRAGQASPSAVEALIREVVGQVAFEQGELLSLCELESLAGGIVDDFLRYGPLQPLLDDPASPRSWSTAAEWTRPIRRCRFAPPSCT